MVNKDFPDGVSWFTHGQIVLPCHFPYDKVVCRHCDFCYKESGMERFRCRLTNEMLYAPDVEIGRSCPVEIIGSDK